MKKVQFNKTKESFRKLPLTFAATDTGFKGYVTVFNALSGDRGGFLALFPPDSLNLPFYDVVSYYNHNDDLILGSESSGTLKIGVDDKGVFVEGVLGDTYLDQFIKDRIQRGIIKGMSAGIYVLNLHREKRVITEADTATNIELLSLLGQEVEVEIYDQWVLDEVTITGRPALPQTSVELLSQYKKNDENKEGTVQDFTELYKQELELANLVLKVRGQRTPITKKGDH